MPDMDARARLGALIKDRRRSLGMTMASAAAAAGIDRNTWSTGEAGRRRIADSSYAGIERALRWEPGSIATVLAGGDPTPTSGSAAPNGPLDLDERAVAEIERIRGLPMSTEHRLRLIRAVIDMYVEAENERAAREAEQRQAGEREAS